MPDPTTKTVHVRKGKRLVIVATLPSWTRHGEAQRVADALAYLLNTTIIIEEGGGHELPKIHPGLDEEPL
jgi:hypothetical protein